MNLIFQSIQRYIEEKQSADLRMNHREHSRFFAHGIRPFLALTATAFLLAGCPNPAEPDPPLSPAQKILQDVKKRDINDLIITADPAAKAAVKSPSSASEKINILLFIPGGPLFEASEFNLTAVGAYIAPSTHYARGVLQQEQIIRYRTVPPGEIISLEKAEEINLHSAAVIYAAADYFKNRGHKVSLYSHSFGSFVVPEMLRRYGDEPFEKILIGAGRLNMPKLVHENVFKGKPASFTVDGSGLAAEVQLYPFTIEQDVENQIAHAKAKSADFCDPAYKTPGNSLVQKKDICKEGSVDPKKKADYINTRRSGMRLQAALGRNRGTSLLEGKLAKVIYYFGGRDRAVGSLTVPEVNALTGKSIADLKSSESSKDVTRTIGPRTETQKVHTINGISGRASVKYSLEDGHGLGFLFQDRETDVLKSFGIGA